MGVSHFLKITIHPYFFKISLKILPVPSNIECSFSISIPNCLNNALMSEFTNYG